MASTTLLDPEVGYSQSDLKGLSVRQRNFIGEMLKDLQMSPTEAARKVGYRNPQKEGLKLLNQPKINRILSAAQNQKEKDFRIESYEVLRMLHKALMLDPLDLFNCTDDGTMTLKDFRKIPKDIRVLVTECKVKTKKIDEEVEEQYISLKWVSKELALQLCMRHLGLLQDKVEIKGSIDVNLVCQLRESIANRSKGVIDANSISNLVEQDT